jgi:acyl-CoA thioesterase I
MMGVEVMARILFALMWVMACGQLQAQTLLVLGDSLSAGYQMQAEQSWPALLQQQWQQTGGQHQLINASISGETTQGALTRLPVLLKEHKPDWLLIELGGNDGLRGFPPAITRQNLAKMLTMAKQQGIHTILTQIQLPPNYGARYLRQFETIFPDLAKENERPLLPFFLDDIATRPELMLNDGIHPKAEAQPLIRDKVARFVEPLLTH